MEFFGYHIKVQIEKMPSGGVFILDGCTNSDPTFCMIINTSAFVSAQIQIPTSSVDPNLFQFENRTDFDRKKEGMKYNNYCVSSNTIIRDLEITNARICDFEITKNSNTQNYIECFHP